MRSSNSWLDLPILQAYYGNADQQRILANENAFRWEYDVDEKRTPFYAASLFGFLDLGTTDESGNQMTSAAKRRGAVFGSSAFS